MLTYNATNLTRDWLNEQLAQGLLVPCAAEPDFGRIPKREIFVTRQLGGYIKKTIRCQRPRVKKDLSAYDHLMNTSIAFVSGEKLGASKIFVPIICSEKRFWRVQIIHGNFKKKGSPGFRLGGFWLQEDIFVGIDARRKTKLGNETEYRSWVRYMEGWVKKYQAPVFIVGGL